MMRTAVRIALDAKRREEERKRKERGREKEADNGLSLVLVVSNGLVRLKATQHGGWGINRVIRLGVIEVDVAPRRQSSTRRPDESRQTD
jgi:hypothetical protein